MSTRQLAPFVAGVLMKAAAMPAAAADTPAEITVRDFDLRPALDDAVQRAMVESSTPPANGSREDSACFTCGSEQEF
jgi:hypothetical protein